MDESDDDDQGDDDMTEAGDAEMEELKMSEAGEDEQEELESELSSASYEANDEDYKEAD